MIKTQGR